MNLENFYNAISSLIWFFFFQFENKITIHFNQNHDNIIRTNTIYLKTNLQKSTISPMVTETELI